jgi:hypothetical protein
MKLLRLKPEISNKDTKMLNKEKIYLRIKLAGKGNSPLYLKAEGILA